MVAVDKYREYFTEKQIKFEKCRNNIEITKVEDLESSVKKRPA